MKAFKETWCGASTSTRFPAEEAVARRLTPDPYESGGRIEELEARVEGLTDVIAALAGLLYEKAVIDGSDVARICPNVEEDLDALG